MVTINDKVQAYLVAARNLILGSNLKTFRLPPRKAYAYVAQCLFIDGVLHGKNGLPQKHVWEVLGAPEELPIAIRPNHTSDWLYSIASITVDFLALGALARILKPSIIFEIGTFRGSGAIHLAANAPQACVYTLDLASNQTPILKTMIIDPDLFHASDQQNFGDRIHRLYGDSATFDFSPFHKRVDLFFIDGGHSYEYVRNDTIKALECTHEGSVIAWHDYGRVGVGGVTRWLNEFRKGRQIYRVPGGSLAYMLC